MDEYTEDSARPPQEKASGRKRCKSKLDREALKDEGRRRKDCGMALALKFKCHKVAKGVLAMLEALFRSPDGTATIDDATSDEDLANPFADDGKWRGSVTRYLSSRNIIAPNGLATSCRPSRHGGDVKKWRLIDRAKAEALAKAIRSDLAALEQAYSTHKQPTQKQLPLEGAE